MIDSKLLIEEFKKHNGIMRTADIGASREDFFYTLLSILNADLQLMQIICWRINSEFRHLCEFYPFDRRIRVIVKVAHRLRLRVGRWHWELKTP